MPNLNKAFQWWKNTCNAPRIAYSQKYRNQRYLPEYDVTCYDCSSFVWYGLIDGGFDCVGAYGGETWPFTTGTMGAVLVRLGFTEYRSNALNPVLPGDIFVDPGVHTEVAYQQGTPSSVVTMGAHDYGPPVHPDLGNTPLPDQVSINSYASNVGGNYAFVYRLGAGGATGYGCTAYVIAALCGNAWAESTVNSGRHQTPGTAYGMFQWDGSRQTRLLQWLAQNGYSQDDPIGQLQFLVYEGETWPSDAWVPNAEASALGITNLTKFLESTSTDIRLLTRLFCNCWERPGIPRLDERYRFAELAYPYIIANGNTGDINTWFISTNALGEDQALNNSVLVYRFFSAGGGGGWPFGMPPRYPHKMPVWMMTRKFYS